MKWASSLIRIANHEVETLQKRLAEIVERRWAVDQQLEALEVELANERANVSAFEAVGFYMAGFEEGVKVRRAALQLRLTEVAAEEAGARDALTEAFEVLKKYEHVLETAKVAEKREAAKRETAQMDELGLRRATK